MTDYSKSTYRTLTKRAAIWLLEVPWINAPVVGALRHFPSARWRQRLPVIHGTGQISLPDDRVIELLDPSRCSVAREIWWNNGQLADGADRIALELAIRLSKGADLFLDIGSYTGLFALAVSRCNDDIRCVAFEIVPENVLLLWRNVIHNNLIGRVQVNFKGAGEAPRVIRVPLALEAGVLPSSFAIDSSASNGVDIPVDSIDRMVEKQSGRVVMKIDVEGFEWNVLSGARQLIEDTRPDIICEFLTRTESIPMVMSFLDRLGYQYYRITSQGLIKEKIIEPVKHERDWLLTTQSDFPELDELRKIG